MKIERIARITCGALVCLMTLGLPTIVAAADCPAGTTEKAAKTMGCTYVPLPDCPAGTAAKAAKLQNCKLPVCPAGTAEKAAEQLGCTIAQQ